MGSFPSRNKRNKKSTKQTKAVHVTRDHEQGHPWANLGFQLCKKGIGEKAFEEKMAEADMAPPEPGPFSSSQMAFYVKRYQAKFALKALATQQCGKYLVGVGASGNLNVLTNPHLPENNFFIPGRVFPVRLRHTNLVRCDDAQLDVRSVSLKFADTEFESPFDLMMHTGEQAAFWNIVSFDKMLTALAGGPDAFEEFCLESPWHFHLAISAFRRAPDSFTDQRYYSWMAFDYKAKDGVPRYAKFRLIPADERPESGLMSESDQKKPWEYFRWTNERRESNYLISEFRDRITQGSIKYKLQIQQHEVKPGDSHLVLNASRAWNQANHPWLDLAHITLTSLLPWDVVEDTRFSQKNIPPSIAIPAVKTIFDYSSTVHLGTNVFTFFVDSSAKKMQCRISEDESIYCISVRTGNRQGAGTDAKVSLTITGTTGRTKPLVLDKWLHDDFEAGQEDTYVVDAVDVGELLLIKLEKTQGSLYSDWFVDKVLITCSQSPHKLYEFPCFRWIQIESVIFEGTAKLVTEDQHDVFRNQRRLEIQQRQESYQWGDDQRFNNLPGFIKTDSTKTLPRDVQFITEVDDNLREACNKTLPNQALAKMINSVDSWEEFDDYRKAFSSFDGEIPTAAYRWQDDRFYGSQFMNGCNPDTIKRCTALPSNFPVTQEIVGNLLNEGDILETAAQEGRLYMVDYRQLEDVPQYGESNEELDRRYSCAAMGLFYVRSTGDLVPIAIQLHQVPCETNPIWTPNDSELDWIFAKMWLRNADTQWHQSITSFLRTHLFMEPVALACWRQLPSIHPLWKLLVPFIRGVLAVCTFTRKHQIPSMGVADSILSVGGEGQLLLMQKIYKTTSWRSFDLPASLKERGVLDAEKLPGFYYRDDAMQLWKAIEGFVTKILHIYYSTDDKIAQDTELQSWISDLHDNGYPVRDGDVDHGFPSSVTSREQLVHLLTIVIFTCACQHAAVNFSQMDVFGFPPNTPVLMRQPPPTKKGAVTVKDIMACLPTKHQATVTIATMLEVMRLFANEKFSGDLSEGLFIDRSAQEAILCFQGKLSAISKSIATRNKTLEVPYTYLLPMAGGLYRGPLSTVAIK